MLQIKNVNLNVGNTALLSNINLTLEQGKIYGVLGPNGAGKTTLFKSMLGLTDFFREKYFRTGSPFLVDVLEV